MTVFLNSIYAEWYDESQEAIYKNLKAAGASKQTMDRLDHVSRIGGFGPDPQSPQDGLLYSTLVLEGLSEVAKKARTQARSASAKASSTASAKKSSSKS